MNDTVGYWSVNDALSCILHGKRVEYVRYDIGQTKRQSMIDKESDNYDEN